jgi:4-aminobutyrate aminotransferase-like enzyme
MRERSLAAFPAGSNGEFDLPGELTMVIGHGEGCRLWDTEGREFMDFSMGWGSVLVGHARAEIVEAVTRQAKRGSNFAYITENALLLAEEILGLSPACDALRFCASGTEATMYCQRLARAFTGRTRRLSRRQRGRRHQPVPPPATGLSQTGSDQRRHRPYRRARRAGGAVQRYRDHGGDHRGRGG